MPTKHPRIAMALAVASALVVLGSPGPWLSGLLARAEGMDGDGQITLALGGLALVLSAISLKRRSSWLDAGATVALATAGSIGLTDWLSGQGMLAMTNGTHDAGWGLQLVTVGALSAVMLAFAAGAWGTWDRIAERVRIDRRDDT